MVERMETVRESPGNIEDVHRSGLEPLQYPDEEMRLIERRAPTSSL
jgi:hypothetical protein